VSLPDDPVAYRAPRWLPGGHAQTLYAALAPARARVEYVRERWETPDGDFIDLDWLARPADHRTPGAAADANAPLVALFHGLEGSSRSPYALATMHALARAGWHGVVVHFRGCGGEPNRLPRAYHSGDATEIGWILARLRAASPSRALFAAGVSLGGNALLKWLGEQGEAAVRTLDAAAAVSAPVDLMAAGDALGSGFNRVYTAHFLRTLKPKSLAKLARFPGLVDAAAVRRARTLRAFDDAVTAPLHGFRGTDDYWTRASSKPWLARIAVPTLMVNARNDPFLPGRALPVPTEVSASVTLDFPEEGGHAGFVTGTFPGHRDWLPHRLIRYFASHCTRAVENDPG